MPIFRALLLSLLVVGGAWGQVISGSGGGGTVVISGASATAVNCGGTVTTGGTAQQIVSSAQNLHGFQVQVVVNGSNTDPLYISDLTTTPGPSSSNNLGSLNPSTSTSAGGSYNTPLNYPVGNAVYLYGATTGDKFSCRAW